MKPLPKMPKTKKESKQEVPPKKPPIDSTDRTATKKHERAAKPSEKDRKERAHRMAAEILVKTQGLDPETAAAVVASMEHEDIENIISESNTEVMNRDKKEPVANGAVEDDGPMVDFSQVPELATNEEFPDMVLTCVRSSRVKNAAEKEYKETKAKVIALLNGLGISRVECMSVKLTVYPGKTSWLDEHLLLEAGVDPDVIKRCWKSTPWDDVRVTAPKDMEV